MVQKLMYSLNFNSAALYYYCLITILCYSYLKLFGIIMYSVNAEFFSSVLNVWHILPTIALFLKTSVIFSSVTIVKWIVDFYTH